MRSAWVFSGVDFGHAGEGAVIERGDLLARRDPAVQPRQLRQAQGALHVRQAVIVAQLGHVIGMGAAGFARAMVAVDAVIAEAAHMGGHLRIVGHRHAAFAGGQMLDRMEGETGNIAPGCRVLRPL